MCLPERAVSRIGHRRSPFDARERPARGFVTVGRAQRSVWADRPFRRYLEFKNHRPHARRAGRGIVLFGIGRVFLMRSPKAPIAETNPIVIPSPMTCRSPNL
ncbi:hypothetical protein BYI23_A025850 [Burkholderia sp. YI23]|nr:hypothetical protein BYI23_A025850 [Burkholderia sp. YI23]